MELRLPKDLIELDRWILWRRQKDTKVPYSAHTGRAASSTKREDWVTYDEAVEAFERQSERYSGLGFVFTADDGLCGVDLDDCISSSAGRSVLKPWAREILDTLPSYAEISPSGTGVKLWVRAKLPGCGLKVFIDSAGRPLHDVTDPKRDTRIDGGFEVYDRGRYFTVTGRLLNNTFVDIEDCQDAITKLYERFRKPTRDFTPQPFNSDRIPGEKVKAGGRHDYLMRLAAQFRSKGMGPVEITAALKPINSLQCEPPKSEAELDGIVKWVCEKPAGELPKLQHESEKAGSLRGPDIPAADEYTLPTEDPEKPKPNDIARLIMRDHPLLHEPSGLIYEYNGRFWERIAESQLQSYALRYDTHQYTKRSRRSEAASYILDATLRKDVPWRNLAAAEVPCWNGVVDVNTCEVRPHRKDDYLETVIPHPYDPSHRCHLWLSVLERWFRGDTDEEAKIDALQEFMGYCLLPHAKFKKAMFLYGESDTGKSVVPMVIGDLVGQRNKCTLSTDQMADERKRAPIVGKMVNLLTELPAEAMIADGGFKQLVSTGDPISIDPKFKEPFDYVPFCKHVICTNNLPTINDLSRATFNRFLLIKFNNVIPTHEQKKDLQRELQAELPGILAWAVEGADRLIQRNGEFTRIAESTTAITEYRAEQNPINEFIAEKCRVDADDWIPTSDFREKFSKWLGRQISPRALATMLRSAGFKIEVRNQTLIKKSTRAVVGIGWDGYIGQ